MLDLRRLRLLRELHERGTIAAVADALQFTPSAVSQQLAMLERETGIRLLERAGRGVRLTDPALVLVEHAEALLERASRAEADLAGAAAGGAGPALRAGRGRARGSAAGARTRRPRSRSRRRVAVSPLAPAAGPPAARASAGSRQRVPAGSPPGRPTTS